MNNNTILIILAIIAVAYFVYKMLVSNQATVSKLKQAPVYQYEAKAYPMTKSESDFFKILLDVSGDRYYVFPQVHLSTILNHKINGQPWKPAFNHINGKSVDYVLCDKQTLKPVYAVELDDKSHESETRQERDREVERIFKAANLPLVRFSNYISLSQDDIAQRFIEAHNLAEAN